MTTQERGVRSEFTIGTTTVIVDKFDAGDGPGGWLHLIEGRLSYAIGLTIEEMKELRWAIDVVLDELIAADEQQGELGPDERRLMSQQDREDFEARR